MAIAWVVCIVCCKKKRESYRQHTLHMTTPSRTGSGPTVRVRCIAWVHSGFCDASQFHILKALREKHAMDVRNFFDVETALRFFYANVKFGEVKVFCVVVTAASMAACVSEMQRYVDSLGPQDARGRPVRFYYYGPRLVDSNLRNDVDRAFFSADDSPDEFIQCIAEEYQQTAAGSGGGGDKSKGPAEFYMPPPEGAPPTAKYVGDGPQGSVFCYDEADGRKMTIRCFAEDKQVLWNKTVRLQLQKLSHPSILNVTRCEPEVDVGRITLAFTPFFSNHFDRMFRDEMLPECIAVRALRVVLDALRHLHSVGFVMPCVTPYQLVLCSTKLRVATMYAFPTEEAHKFMDVMYRWYLAPECQREPCPAFTPRSDVWSVGCLLVRLLSGKIPWSEQDLSDKSWFTMMADYDIHPKLPPRCSQQMKDFILQCFAHDPQSRPSVAQLLLHPLLSMDEVIADDLATAQFTVSPIPTRAREYEKIKENFNRALLKAADIRFQLELVGVSEVHNEVLRNRFSLKLSAIGNRQIAFYGAPPDKKASVLRVGVLRLGHPLTGAGGRSTGSVSSFLTLGDRTKGIHLFKFPTKAVPYANNKADLRIGDVVDIIMMDVCLGNLDVASPTRRQSSAMFDEGSSLSGQSRESDTEFYLFDEAQACPAYILSVRVAPALAQVSELPPKYVVFPKKELGHGAFGRVLMGMEFPRGIPVAVKQFECRSGADEVKAEFDTLVSLKGFKHVMGVRHFEITEGRACMVMELLSMSINDVIRNAGGPLPESVVRKYMFEAAQGLEELGTEGIIHRDIKPDNMMIAPDGTLKLTDFGLSVTRAHTMPQQDDEFSCGVKGTPLFLAPELLNGVQCTPASDIWALGCSVVCMLRGSRSPYIPCSETDNAVQLMYAIGSQTIRPQMPAQVSDGLRGLVERCIAADPAVRPKAADIQIELSRLNAESDGIVAEGGAAIMFADTDSSAIVQAVASSTLGDTLINSPPDEPTCSTIDLS